MKAQKPFTEEAILTTIPYMAYLLNLQSLFGIKRCPIASSGTFCAPIKIGLFENNYR
jgi:hypothetical protein